MANRRSIAALVRAMDWVLRSRTSCTITHMAPTTPTITVQYNMAISTCAPPVVRAGGPGVIMAVSPRIPNCTGDHTGLLQRHDAERQAVQQAAGFISRRHGARRGGACWHVFLDIDASIRMLAQREADFVQPCECSRTIGCPGGS